MARIRRCIACLTAIVLAFACIVTIRPAKAHTFDFGIVYNSSKVNLRSQPTQNSTWLGAYPSGTWMSITGQSGNWYSVVAPDGKTGYMSKNYVRIPQDRHGNIVVVSNPKATGFLNMREYPSTSARVVDIYYNDVPCVVLGYSNGWYYVNIDGKLGYLLGEYVYEVSNIAYSSEVATVVTANRGALNMRHGPGTQYTTWQQVDHGDYVMVLEKGQDWWLVSHAGSVGYVMASFLRDGVLKPNEINASGSTSGGNTQTGNNNSAVVPSNGYAIVTNPRPTQLLNLRELPSSDARVLAQYRNGTRLQMLEQGAEWCKVYVVATGKTGYMMTRYLTLNNLPAVPTMTVTHPQRTFVNLRTAPSMSTGRIVIRMPHGAEVTVIEPGETWVKVSYNGYTGYAMAYYLK